MCKNWFVWHRDSGTITWLKIEMLFSTKQDAANVMTAMQSANDTMDIIMLPAGMDPNKAYIK
jgi:hypothetical protein